MVLVDGALGLFVERGGKTVLDFLAADDEAGREAAAASLAGTVRASGGKLRVEKIDGEFSVGTVLGDALVRAGFAADAAGSAAAGLAAAEEKAVPEGDTVYQTAKRQNEALAGLVLTGFELRVPKFAAADLTGETVHEVVSRRQAPLPPHRRLVAALAPEDGGLLAPRAPRAGAWPKPAFQARAVLRTASVTSIGFELGITELLPRDDEHTVTDRLGPDLLGPGWNDAAAAEAVRRLEAHPADPVFGAVLDQTNLAGVGNVYANELCFLRGILPTTPDGRGGCRGRSSRSPAACCSPTETGCRG